MSTVAFTAQALGAGETQEMRALLLRGLAVAALIGAALIAAANPARRDPARRDGRQRRRHPRREDLLRHPDLVGAAGAGQLCRARLADRTGARQARACGADRDQPHQHGGDGAAGAGARHTASPVPRSPPSLRKRPDSCSALSSPARFAPGKPAIPRAALLDRAKLLRMLAVNRDIMIRTAALIAVFLFFTAQGARSGDVTLAANARAEQFPADQRVLPRRPRQRRRATLRPRLWRARPRRLLGRGAAGDPLGICLCARGGRHLTRCSART